MFSIQQQKLLGNLVLQLYFVAGHLPVVGDGCLIPPTLRL
jgi:hypothetical protein